MAGWVGGWVWRLARVYAKLALLAYCTNLQPQLPCPPAPLQQYTDAHPSRPSFAAQLDTLCALLPAYQGVPLQALRPRRVLFGGESRLLCMHACGCSCACGCMWCYACTDAGWHSGAGAPSTPHAVADANPSCLPDPRPLLPCCHAPPPPRPLPQASPATAMLRWRQPGTACCRSEMLARGSRRSALAASGPWWV